MSDQYTKKCSWCGEFVSVFESLTEFGKHYHHPCMVHKLNLELEGYKKRFLDGKMTPGDKSIFLDKFQLTEKLKTEDKPEFKGWKMIEERKSKIMKEERVMLIDKNLNPILKDGKPQFIIEKSGQGAMTTAILRPDITYTKPPEKNKKSLNPAEARKGLKSADTDIVIVSKKLTLADVPRLMNTI